MFRTVGAAAEVQRALRPLEDRVSIEHLLDIPPVDLMTIADFETAVFPFTTDIPLLERWGTPLLYGPGSIDVAHTAGEFVDVAALDAAVDGYVRIARDLLARM